MSRTFCAVLALCGLAAMGSEIRVRDNGGVPQIHVNGKPVRPRWFWGAPTYTVVKVKPGEQFVEQERMPLEEGDLNVTFHFRFDRKPTTVWLDDFEVLDKTTGEVLFPKESFEAGKVPDDWTFFPQDERNTVGTLSHDPKGGRNGSGALRIDLKNPLAGKAWPDFHVYSVARPMKLVVGHDYVIRFWIKSTVETSLNQGVYRPASPSFVKLMGDKQFQQQIGLAMDVGIDFISPAIPTPWPRPGEEADWKAVDTVVEQILSVNPRAKLVPRVGLMPPQWWFDKHPGEVMEWREPKAHHDRVYSVSSLVWRRDATERLRALIEYLEAKYPDNMAGYHPCGQETSEWFYKDSWRQDYHGYSPCERQAFKAWIAKRYGIDAALQKAWGDPGVTLSTVDVPALEARRNASTYGMLLVPGEAQPVIDHNLFLQDEMTDAMLVLAKTVREATSGRRLCVFFYGYGYEFAGMGRMSASGHLGLRKILGSSDIDILCSPISYTDRQLGGGGHAMTVAESVLLSGKLWLYEDDTRTYLAAGGTLGGLSYHAADLWESQQILRRNTAQEIVRNLACWWMDLCCVGWYNDPELWRVMAELAPLDEAKLASPRVYAPPVACVFDEYSAVYTLNGRPVTGYLISELRKAMSRLGAAFGQYMLDDLIAGKVSSRLVVLQNSWVLDGARRKGLKSALSGKFALWCHAPGVLDPVSGVSLAESRELTGYGLRRLEPLQESMVIKSTELGQSLGMPKEWWIEAKTPLLMSVEEGEGDQVLARWWDGSAAVVLRENSIFCGSTKVPWELLRLACQRAGVHVWTDRECVFYTDDKLVVLHATNAGDVTLTLPKAGRVFDAIGGKMLTNGKASKLAVGLKFGETRVLWIE